jgi:hypothetical protein
MLLKTKRRNGNSWKSTTHLKINQKELQSVEIARKKSQHLERYWDLKSNCKPNA